MLTAGTRIDPPIAVGFTSNGLAGVAITFPVAAPAATFHVSICWTANPAGEAGEWWVGSKTTAGFTLYHNGTAGITGTYAITSY